MNRRNLYTTFGMLMAALLLWAFQTKRSDIRVFLAGDSTMSIKELKAYPEAGWGMPFVHFWDSSVTVVNKAKNGRSSRTFIEEGLWQSILQEGKAGDYVFIQFCHNDEVPTKKSYTKPEEYKNNLRRFVDEARSKGMTAVLMTPVSRRKFDAQGQQEETHPEYIAYIQEVAKEKKVLLFDMNKATKALYQQFGEAQSKWLFLQLKPGEHPNYPEGKEDNTHFNELGARLVAQLVLQEIKSQLPELYSRTVNRSKK